MVNARFGAAPLSYHPALAVVYRFQHPQAAHSFLLEVSRFFVAYGHDVVSPDAELVLFRKVGHARQCRFAVCPGIQLE